MSLIELPPAPPPPRAVEPVKPLKSVEPSRKEPRREVVPSPAEDELAFLRSVTEDESHGPAAASASGSMRAIQEPVPAEPPTKGYADSDAKKGATPRSSKATKSLKCKECGTMNLPTEWYCERCGAELAAL
jgi:hypothetical protein